MILCILYTIEAALMYFLLYKRSRDPLNPFAISIGTWLITAGISQINIGKLLAEWNLMTHIIVQVFAFVIFLIGLKRNKVAGTYYYSDLNVKINNRFIFGSRVIFFVALFCALIEWKNNNFVVTAFLTSTVDLKSDLEVLSGIHYGTVCLPYCALLALYEIYYRKNKSIITWIYSLSVLVICLVYSTFIEVSRGNLLIILLGGVLLTHSRYRINFSKLIRYGLIILCIMGIVLLIRIQNRNSMVYTATGSYTWWSPFYLYFATCFDNLNSLINNGSPMTICYATILKPILDVFNIQLNIPLTEYQYSFFNAKTMIYYFYHDLGIIGVIIFTSIIYLVVLRVYKKAKYDSNYLLLLAALQKSIFMVFFGNYFTGVFCPSFPFIVIWLLCIYSRTNIIWGRIGKKKLVQHIQN